MHNKGHPHPLLFRVGWEPANAAILILLAVLLLILLFVFLTFTAQPAQGDSYEPAEILAESGVALALLAI